MNSGQKIVVTLSKMLKKPIWGSKTGVFFSHNTRFLKHEWQSKSFQINVILYISFFAFKISEYKQKVLYWPFYWSKVGPFIQIFLFYKGVESYMLKT